MSFFTSKVTPAPQKKLQEKEEEGRNDGNDAKAPVEIHVMSLHDFQMWLISLENLLMLYGGEKGNRRVMDVHQELKRRDLLTSWCDAPADAEIIFVSAHSSHSGHSLTLFTELSLHSPGYA